MSLEVARDAADNGMLLSVRDRLSEMDDALTSLGRNPSDPALLDHVFREFHAVKGSVGFLGVDAMHEICNLTENILEAVRRRAMSLDRQAIDLIVWAVSQVRLMTSALLSGLSPPEAPVGLLDALRGAPGGAGADGSSLAPLATGIRSSPREACIRVECERLDRIMEISVQIGAEVGRLAAAMGAGGAAVARLESLAVDLKRSAQQARMQPLADLFQHHARLVRDLCRRLGKDVDLQIQCGESEIDKAVVDEMRDPLVQLVRNAIDHGIEEIAERAAAGKARSGVLHLSARQAGDRVLLEVSDDGRGICPEAVRRKAVERGILDAKEASALDDDASLALIFRAGLSTKERPTEISGRGVGMDVVRASVERLSGRIEVESAVGVGTTFRIEVPLQVGIVPALIIQAGALIYAVPLANVHRVVALPYPAEGVEGEGPPPPVHSLCEHDRPPCGVVLSAGRAGEFVLGIDGIVGRDGVLVRSSAGVLATPTVVASRCSDGAWVLLLDVEALAEQAPGPWRLDPRMG